MESTSSNCDKGLVSSNSEKVSELNKEVRFLRSKTEQQEITKLRENQKTINDLLRSQERYSSKDCKLNSNPPFEARNSVDVTQDTLKFFQIFLWMKIDYNRIKFCHLVPSKNATVTTSTVICKFIFYQDKIDVYKKRRILQNKRKLYEQAKYIHVRIDAWMWTGNT